MEDKSVSSGNNDSSTVAKLITGPFLILVTYGIVLGVAGHSWWWLVSVALMCITVSLALIWRVEVGKPKGFLKIFLYVVLEFLAISLLAPITLRLAFYDGIWQLIQSVLHFNVVGILIAVVAVYFGHKIATFFNKVYSLLK